MRVSIGCRLRYSFPQPTPLIALLNVHYSRFGDLERADYLVTSPSVPLESYRDGFGNWCTRLVAPAKLRAVAPYGTGWRLTIDTDTGRRNVTAQLVMDAGGRGAPLARRLGAVRRNTDRLIAVWLHGTVTW